MALIVAAVLGLACIAVGVTLVFPPAGLIVAGVEIVASAYLIADNR